MWPYLHGTTLSLHGQLQCGYVYTITPLLFSRRLSKTRALHLHTIKPRKFVSVTVRSQEQVALVSIREQLYFRNKSWHYICRRGKEKAIRKGACLCWEKILCACVSKHRSSLIRCDHSIAVSKFIVMAIITQLELTKLLTIQSFQPATCTPKTQTPHDSFGEFCQPTMLY